MRPLLGVRISMPNPLFFVGLTLTILTDLVPVLLIPLVYWLVASTDVKFILPKVRK